MNPTLIRLGFTQGVKTQFDPSSVPVNALWQGYNFAGDESGILRTRRGGKNFNPSLGLGRAQGVIQAFDGFLLVWNRKVYKVSNTGVNTELSPEVLVGTTPADSVEMIRCSRGGAEIGYIFGGNGIYETNGGTVSLVTPYTPLSGEPPNLLRASDGSQDVNSGPAKCRIATLRASLSQRIALASGNTVYLSAPLDGTYYPDNQVFQLPDDGGKIVWLANWYGALVIFRDRDIWCFFGPDVTSPDAALVVQDTSVGCVAGRTVAAVPGVGLVFLGPDNVYALQGVSGIPDQMKAVPIGDDIRKHLLKNMPYLDGVCGIYYNREYRLCFPNTLEQISTFRLNLQDSPRWFMDTGPRVSQFVTKDQELYGSRYDRGQLLKFRNDWLLDDDNPIPFYVSFRREDLQPGPASITRILIYVLAKGQLAKKPLFFWGAPFNRVPFNVGDKLEVTYVTGTEQHLKVIVVVDGEEFEIRNFAISVGKVSHLELAEVEPVLIYEARFRPTLKGHFIQLKIRNDNPEEDTAILGYAVEYVPRGDIKGRRKGVEIL